MKKWWIAGVASVALFSAVMVWGLWPRQDIRIVRHDPRFVIYDIRYFPQTNRIHYWRAAWRDTLNLLGLMKPRAQSMASEHGPALVVYHSKLGGNGPDAPVLMRNEYGPVGDHASTEYFGDKCVTKFFFEGITNGVYHLAAFRGPSRGWTNLVDIYVDLKD